MYKQEFYNELYHHGIKGMKWGIRRYQNKDGTLTPAGRKRQNKNMSSDKSTVFAKGHTFYRVSGNYDSDANGEKVYVNANEECGDFYVTVLGKSKIAKDGKAFVHEYTANTDIRMPDKKTMEKIELGLLKDKAVREEIIDSLIAKGVSRENAEKQVKAYSVGQAAVERIKNASLMALAGGAYGAMFGAGTGTVPGILIGAGGGAVAGGIAGAMIKPKDKERALNTVRVSYGDKNNKVTNDTLQKRLAEKGYNAMKDYNDRRAFGENGKQAMIVFDSAKNLSLKSSSKLTEDNFAKSYARDYQRQHPNSESNYGSLIEAGKKLYKQTYEDGVVNREKAKELEEERKRLLAKGSS